MILGKPFTLHPKALGFFSLANGKHQCGTCYRLTFCIHGLIHQTIAFQNLESTLVEFLQQKTFKSLVAFQPVCVYLRHQITRSDFLFQIFHNSLAVQHIRQIHFMQQFLVRFGYITLRHFLCHKMLPRRFRLFFRLGLGSYRYFRLRWRIRWPPTAEQVAEKNYTHDLQNV